MYAQFFGLRELPFNNTPDPRFFYSTPDHEEALASLIYAVQERKGFVLLTGEIGAGKTLVSRMMLRHFGTMIGFATINHAVQDAKDLLESICSEFELHVPKNSSRTALVRLLHDYLLSQFAQNQPVVLVLDEAQNLCVEAFEQLRMIGNLEADDAKLLQIVIVGQPELQQRFASPDLCQLRQRIFRSYHLPAMSRDATEGYIQHRLSVAGAESPSMFTADAIDRVFDFAQGVPRVINTLCDNAMLSAYSADQHEIAGAFVESVIKQMMVSKPTSSHTGTATDTRSVRPATKEPAVALPARPDRRSPSLQPVARRAQQPATNVATRPTPPARDRRAERRVNRRRAAAPPVPHVSSHSAYQHELNLETNALLAKARTIRAELEPVVRRAEALLTRSELAVRDLDRKEERLHNVDRVVSGVVRDLRALLDRAHRLIPARATGPQAARNTCRQIANEAQNCRRLAGKLSARTLKDAANGTDHPGPTEGPGRVLRSAEAERSRVEGFRRRADELRDRLRATNSEPKRSAAPPNSTGAATDAAVTAPESRPADQPNAATDSTA